MSSLAARATMLIGLALAAGCSAQAPATTPPSTQQSAAPSAAPAPATFVNRVWRVAESTAVSPGQLYVFLSEGTLVMASTTGTPSLGTWSRAGDGLTMVEESRPYNVEILSLTATEFRIRSHNPGQPVDIRLVPAEGDRPAAAATPR